jgi:hypothetical protein
LPASPGIDVRFEVPGDDTFLDKATAVVDGESGLSDSENGRQQEESPNFIFLLCKEWWAKGDPAYVGKNTTQFHSCISFGKTMP